MHILVVNDDGPPSNQSSPYIHSLVSTLQSVGHTVSVILPHTQRSWIGKAHIVGQTLTATHFRPGTLHQDDGVVSSTPFDDGKDEWVLIDGTPASCVQIGLWHEFQDRGPVDLVLSGPNYGRNTTAVFALSSGTIGGALEGAVCGKKAVALSYAFDSREHDPEIIAAASKLSSRLIEKLYKEWPEDVHLYSINVPLRKGVESTQIFYTDMLQNQWRHGSSFEAIPAVANGNVDPAEHEKKIREGQTTSGDTTEANKGNAKTSMQGQGKKYKWAPNFADVREAVQQAGSGDGWTVLQGMVSVTPLKANFWHVPEIKGEIKLGEDTTAVPMRSKSCASIHKPSLYAVVDYSESYVQPLILRALSSQLSQLPYELISSLADLPSLSSPLLQFTGYEALDFEHALQHSTTSLVCAYVIRKALIRKHYLSNTVSSWLVKHPQSFLQKHFKPAVHFELDFAEFLEEALVDAWDLNESFSRNDACGRGSKNTEWWILKPGMSDGGNGIRLFSTLEELQEVFEEWEDSQTNNEEDDDEIGGAQQPVIERDPDNKVNTSDGGMTSQLRHFIAQPYIHPPLLLRSKDAKKFHIRVYVLAAGALKVYVYKEMLALFASKPYVSPQQGANDDKGIELAAHLTNTCFQDGSTRDGAVCRFWDLEDDAALNDDWKRKVWEQVCDVTGEVFEAAAREQVVHFQTLPNAFEIFGVDFLVDADLNTWLLELNAYPDFKQTGEVLQDAVIGGLFEQVVTVAVRPFFTDSTSGGSESMRLVTDIDLGRK